jgi:hypothetical protein
VGRAILPAAAFQAAFRDVSEPSREKGRLKAGCSQDWLPHNLGGMVSRIKKYAAVPAIFRQLSQRFRQRQTVQ